MKSQRWKIEVQCFVHHSILVCFLRLRRKKKLLSSPATDWHRQLSVGFYLLLLFEWMRCPGKVEGQSWFKACYHSLLQYNQHQFKLNDSFLPCYANDRSQADIGDWKWKDKCGSHFCFIHSISVFLIAFIYIEFIANHSYKPHLYSTSLSRGSIVGLNRDLLWHCFYSSWTWPHILK